MCPHALHDDLGCEEGIVEAVNVVAHVTAGIGFVMVVVLLLHLIVHIDDQLVQVVHVLPERRRLLCKYDSQTQSENTHYQVYKHDDRTQSENKYCQVYKHDNQIQNENTYCQLYKHDNRTQWKYTWSSLQTRH